MGSQYILTTYYLLIVFIYYYSILNLQSATHTTSNRSPNTQRSVRLLYEGRNILETLESFHVRYHRIFNPIIPMNLLDVQASICTVLNTSHLIVLRLSTASHERAHRYVYIHVHSFSKKR